MGYLNTVDVSTAISHLFEKHEVLTCADIEKYCLEHNCHPQIINQNGETVFDDDQLRFRIDIVFNYLLHFKSGEFRLYPDPAIEPIDITKKQKKSLSVFISSENPDWDEVYKIKFRKTKSWKNKPLPILEGVDL